MSEGERESKVFVLGLLMDSPSLTSFFATVPVLMLSNFTNFKGS